MFGVYVMLDDRNVLDAQKVFVSMALINILKTPLSQLPFAISTTMQVPIFKIVYISPYEGFTRPNHPPTYISGCGFTEATGEVPVLRRTQNGQRVKDSTDLRYELHPCVN